MSSRCLECAVPPPPPSTSAPRVFTISPTVTKTAASSSRQSDGLSLDSLLGQSIRTNRQKIQSRTSLYTFLTCSRPLLQKSVESTCGGAWQEGLPPVPPQSNFYLTVASHCAYIKFTVSQCVDFFFFFRPTREHFQHSLCPK